MSEAIRIVEIKKELEKYGSTREKVLRLNELYKFINFIYYWFGHIRVKEDDICVYIHGDSKYFNGGCLFCRGIVNMYNIKQITMSIKNHNVIRYYQCNKCKNKPLCTTCLKDNCNSPTKQKVTFYLSSQKTFPKDIRKFITNLFFKKLIFLY